MKKFMFNTILQTNKNWESDQWHVEVVQTLTGEKALWPQIKANAISIVHEKISPTFEVVLPKWETSGFV